MPQATQSLLIGSWTTPTCMNAQHRSKSVDSNEASEVSTSHNDARINILFHSLTKGKHWKSTASSRHLFLLSQNSGLIKYMPLNECRNEHGRVIDMMIEWRLIWMPYLYNMIDVLHHITILPQTPFSRDCLKCKVLQCAGWPFPNGQRQAFCIDSCGASWYHLEVVIRKKKKFALSRKYLL